MNKIQPKLLIIALLLLVFARVAPAQTTTFTYQGRLSDALMQANGSYDLGFALFDAATDGTQIGAAQTRAAVTVSNGVFTVQLDFGAAVFPSANRFLEIAVKKPSDANFTTLAPRQQITSTPYAIRALNSTNADNAAQLGGTAASQFVQTGDSRLTDSRTPAAGSNNYVQNQNATPQTSTDFNISGTGKANIFDAASQFNIGGNRVLSVAGTQNFFAGHAAGTANTTGSQNTFVGESAGNANTTGRENAFFGFNAGVLNTTGGFNSFFGRNVGNQNTGGTGNSFVGFNSGFTNTSGNNNSFVGRESGFASTTGGSNAFFGYQAGNANTTGDNNTIVGAGANVTANNLNYASAFGSGATVATSNTVVFGRSQDTVNIPGNLSVTGTLTASIDGANITNLNASNIASGTLANARLGIVPTANGGTDLSSSGTTGNFLRSNGTSWTSAAISAADVPVLDANKITSGTFDAARIPNLGASYIQNSTTQQTGNFSISGSGTAGGTLSGNTVNSATQFTIGGSNRKLRIDTNNNTLLGTLRLNNSANEPTVGGSGNSYFGTNTGGTSNPNQAGQAFDFDTSGSNNTLIGANATMGFPALNYATAVGAGARVNVSNTIVLGREDGSDQVTAAGNVGFGGSLSIGGILQVNLLGVDPGVTLCRSNSTLQLSFCSSSIRYKTNVADFASGLNLINKLRPVTFDWKTDGTHDVGFIAEEVNAAEPLLTIYNDKNQVEGVKYDRMSAIFVNAFKEQQT